MTALLQERISMNDELTTVLTGLQQRLERGEITGVSIDSRTVQPGELFIAIRGDRFDGHDFAHAALERGAWGAVVARATPAAAALSGRTNVVVVPDTLQALQELALLHRRRFTLPVVGVTGSNGKTTTKEMLASILGQQGQVLRNEGNLNNHIGVPLTLCKLNAGHRFAVIEMGMSGLGEIATLARLALPGVGVITNIGPAHLAFLGSTETVARAKGELLQGLDAGGTAVLNADDRHYDALRRLAPGRVISFGMDREAEVSAAEITLEGDRTSLLLRSGGRSVRLLLRTVGRHNVANALAAAAAATALGVPLETVRAGLEAFRPVAMRSELRELKGRTIVADYYNANPASMRAALEALAAMGSGRRTVAVLGDMLELGEAGPELHREIGETAARFGTGIVIAVGTLGRHIAEGARSAGMTSGRVFEAGDTSQAATALRDHSRPGDVVLVKGSRGMKMEKILEEF